MSDGTSEIEYPELYTLTMAKPPPVIGSMEIMPGVFYHLTRKPTWLHRHFTRLLLGWKWKDKTA